MTTQPSGASLSSSLLQRAFLESAAQSDEAADPTAERLLDAAFELFCRLGVQRTPMEKVAKSAGVTRVTLYRKFATKDALVDQVVLREFRRYFDRFRAEIPRADTVADRVVVGFVGSLRAISGNPLIGEISDAEPSMLIESMIGGDGMLLAKTRFLQELPGEEVRTETVRFRTVGDATCTGCVESDAADNAAVVAEVAGTRVTERGATRADDRISEAGMEDRKKEGYF